MNQTWLRKLGIPVLDNDRGFLENDEVDYQNLVFDILDEWPDNEPVRLARVLERYPVLAFYQGAQVDVAVEEFKDRRRAGEELSAVEFAQEHPGFQSRLLDSIVVEQGFEENSAWFAAALDEQQRHHQQTSAWPKEGETVCGFKLKERIGVGGFSQVYLAEDLEFPDRQVALKICRKGTHEATTLANLHHSAIGVVYRVQHDEARELTLISMAYRTRTTLHAVANRLWKQQRPGQTSRSAEPVWDEIQTANRLEGTIPEWATSRLEDWVLDIAIDLARGLAASHEENIVHCDIKPSNVLIDRNGKPVLVDFNVAFRKDASKSPANAGGTIPYMAPEQIRALAGHGFADITGQTDLYSLGASLYELLTGTPPFRVVSSAQDGIRPLLEARRQPIRPIRQKARIDREFERLILACMSYEIDERPESAELLANALEQIRKRRLASEARTPKRQRSGWMKGVVAIVLMVAAGLAAALAQQPERQGSIPTPQTEATRQEFVKQGYELLHAGEFEGARPYFEASLNHTPDHFGACLGLARVDLALHTRTPQMQKILDLAGEPTLPLIHAFHGYERILQNDIPKALEVLERARGLGLDSYSLHLNLGYCYYKYGQYERAVQALQRAAQLNPSSDKVRILLIQSELSVAAENRKPFDPVRVRNAFAVCQESPGRFLAEAKTYVFVGRLQYATSKDRDEWRAWSDLAYTAFTRGVDWNRDGERGLSESCWHGIARSLEDSVRKKGAERFAGAPRVGAKFRDGRMYAVNPVIGSELDRCLLASIRRPDRNREDIASRMLSGD